MIGTDIVYLPRLKADSPLARRVLTEEEKKEFEERLSEKRKIDYLGGRFAAKEAIFKATQDQEWLLYSILNGEDGRPYVKDHPEMEVTISHDGDYAIAFVLIKEKEAR